MGLKNERCIFCLWIIAVTISGLRSFSITPSVGIAQQQITRKTNLSGASPHVFDVYKTYSDASTFGQKLQYSEATTIRSFSSKAELLDEGYRSFDLKIPNHEEVVGAELHFFVPLSLFERQDSSDNIKIQLFEVLDEDTFVLLQESTVLPNDFGWKVFNLKSTVKKWINNPNQNYGLKIKVLDPLGKEISSEIIHRLQGNDEPVLIVFSRDLNTSISPLYDTQVANKVESLLSSKTMEDALMKTARKIRSVSSNDDNSCRRHELQLNFADIGWNFVIHPESVDVSICRGVCTENNTTHDTDTYYYNYLLNQAYEAEKIPKEDVPTPSCAPTKYAPLKVIFTDTDGSLVSKELYNSVVTDCGCIY